jgi:hypothetical protein
VASLRQQDTWYPPVRRTVWVLSQLRDFVKPAIFEDIAQEALEVCRLSLISGADLIRTQPGKVLDGHLFLVRHLLILKDVLSSLELDLRGRDDESDFVSAKGPTTSRTLEFGVNSATVGGVGGVTETLTNMLNKTTSFLPDGLFASLGVTRGPDTDFRGVKIVSLRDCFFRNLSHLLICDKDIDKTLRKGCEDVITACSYPICDPLDMWVNQVDTTSGPITRAGLPTSADASSSSTQDLSRSNATTTNLDAILSSASHAQTQFFEALQRDLRPSVSKVRLYLDDARTVKVLLGHVVSRIEVMYERFGGAMFSVKKDMVGSVEDEQVEILSSLGLREVLREVCGDGSLIFSGVAMP